MNLLGSRYFFLKRYTLILIDFLIVNIGFTAGYIYQYYGAGKHPATEILIMYSVFFNGLWLILSYFLQLYSQKTAVEVVDIYRSTWRVTFLHLFLILSFKILDPNVNGKVTFSSLLVCYASITICLTASRFFITYIVEFVIKKVKLQKKTAIIGVNSRAKELAEYFSNRASAYSFQGFFSDHQSLTFAGADSILAPVSECIDYAVSEGIDEIYSTLHPTNNQVYEVLTKAEKHCVRIKFLLDEPGVLHDDNLYKKDSAHKNFKVFSTYDEPLEYYSNRIKKRVFDILMSSFVIIFILSWLVPIVALCIKIESRGSVFFIQKRSGRNNGIFSCLKFRTMRTGYEDDKSHASKADYRVTKIGAFLRKNSIDELPQFFNVFAGSMSIIGPRPHMIEHTEQYSKFINSYMVRQLLKPGITGWAQVNGYRGEIKEPSLMQKRVEHDIWYMENWSLMLDIKVVFMTVINIFKGEDNAY